MNPLKDALAKKAGKVADFLTGTSRVDNAANPTSAYSMMQRKVSSNTPVKKTTLRPQ